MMPLDVPSRPRKHARVKAPRLSEFHRPVAEWFTSCVGTPTSAQTLGWPPIARGMSTLLLAPTGSGKTLAACLAAIDKLMFSPEPTNDERCRGLYVSPLKALAVDGERNLRVTYPRNPLDVPAQQVVARVP